jgi:acetolactate synthase-1/2/3 large subunit
MAPSNGLRSAGPVTDPAELEAMLAEAVAVVEAGRPALVDIITPGF